MDKSKIFRIIARILIGALFIFSGYVKVIDPMGSAIKFGEYFEAFSWHFLAPASLIFGILLAVAEFGLGLCLLFGIRMKEAAWGALLFMIFFTCLTFILAVFNPVEDCGCFGDAIKLTNWETFFKNIVILPFVIYIFIQRKQYKPFISCLGEWVIFAGLVIFSVALSIYTYRHLPLIDFMAYKVGSNIQEGMVMPEGAPMDEYENTFIYEKEGEKKEFTLDNFPDSTWSFVDRKTKLIKKGYTPPTKDFTITNGQGEYVTDSVLSLPGNMIFITSYDIKNANMECVEKINTLYNNAYGHYHFIMLSGSSDEDNAMFIGKTKAKYPIFHTDETVLKSMVRTNPGIMLLKDGTILKKWSFHDMPEVSDIEKILKVDGAEYTIKRHNSCETTTTTILGIIVLTVFGVIIAACKLCKKKCKKE